MLAGFGFAKCYIDDIIVFSLTLTDHMHHLQDVFGRLKEHNLKLHLGKCQVFHTYVEYMGHMIYPGGLGVQKAKVEVIS
jgi:methanogenic corrinoid protein MtbC1